MRKFHPLNSTLKELNLRLSQCSLALLLLCYARD